MQQSKFLTLNWHDLIKGAVVSFLTALFTSVYALFQSGHIPANWSEWKPSLIAGAVGLLAYLSKNFVSNSTGTPAAGEGTVKPDVGGSNPNPGGLPPNP